ncbi:hypothetical protein AMK27_37955 [Streptomyces sp. CB02009]|uniref:hypothetical protein n=1 Tax=Streptomyces sp. CB02009 TaxID=1703938 RepID=UPI000940080E|nr:hypothetical protein [Streptomyces sp. CB02009]OKJ48576.1 hypothetical protein AMK27_37955 [Streptomyces sp. CB02009]
MHLVEFAFAKPPQAPDLSSDVLLAELWAACRPDDGVEHVRVHASRAGARGVAFLLAPDEASAVRRCRALCRRALVLSPALGGWQLAGTVEA